MKNYIILFFSVVLLIWVSCTKSINTSNISGASSFGNRETSQTNSWNNYTDAYLLNQAIIVDQSKYLKDRSLSAFQKFYNKYTVIPQSQIVYYNNLENTIGVNAIIIQTDAIRPTYIVSFTGLNTSSLYDIGSILLFDGSLVNTASIMSPIPINSYSNYTPKITKGLYILLNHFLQTYSIFNTLIQYVENYAQQGKYVQVYFSGHSQGALLSFIMNELFIQYGEGILTRDHIPPAMIHASFVGFACPSLLTKSFLDYMNDIPTQLSKAHLPIQEDSESIYSFKTDLVPYMAGGYIDPLFSYNPETITGYPFSVIGLGLHLLATHTLGLIASRSPESYPLLVKNLPYSQPKVTLIDDIIPISTFNLPPKIDDPKSNFSLLWALHAKNAYAISMGLYPIPNPATGDIW